MHLMPELVCAKDWIKMSLMQILDDVCRLTLPVAGLQVQVSSGTPSVLNRQDCTVPWQVCLALFDFLMS